MFNQLLPGMKQTNSQWLVLCLELSKQCVIYKKDV